MLGTVRWVALLGVVALVVSACDDAADPATTTTATTSTTSVPTTSTSLPPSRGTPVVIDTDMAAEGTMSVLYLLEQSDLDVQAITISGTGLVHCESGVEQALGLLALVDREGIPVACGAEEPLDGINAFPSSWRVAADEAYGVELPRGGAPSDMDAPALMASVIGASPEPVVVYADGPQTNLANALRADPALVDNIAMVYMMGGALDVEGNALRNSDAEWNIWVDPVAADEVLRSGVPITLVPLDATNQVPLHVFHLEALQAHATSPAARVVGAMLENTQIAGGAMYFWDQATAVLLIDESYVTLEAMNVRVVLEENRSVAGATVVDPSGTPVRVATSVDATRFERDFLTALAGEDVGPIVIDTDWTVTFDGTDWTLDAPESIESGAYTVELTNSGPGTAVLVFGWLIEGATLEDLAAWESLSQPPFFELGPVFFTGPESAVVAVAELEGPQRYVVHGLDIDGVEGTTMGVIEVS